MMLAIGEVLWTIDVTKEVLNYYANLTGGLTRVHWTGAGVVTALLP